MVNNFVGVGRMTANAELKYTGGGVACLNFSICINKSYMKGGDWVNKPNFFNCVVWGKYAEAMQKHLTKGRQIGVIGELSQDAWTDGKGTKHSKVNIIVNSISLLALPKNGGNISGQEPPPEAGQGETDVPPDDIPF
jgi:single-strand DNA-binding protein